MLNANKIEIWSANLNISDQQVAEQAAVLSIDEMKRAERFLFPIHKKRFIAARYALRKILSHYLNVAAPEVLFQYNKYQKPELYSPKEPPLFFNLSHSDDVALLAFRLHHPIGIDIEQCKPEINLKLADRYFSTAENKDFQQLHDAEKVPAFYRVWTKKEAFIKAVGKGLTIPLNSFTVSLKANSEQIYFENKLWYLFSLNQYPNFQAAIASNETYQLDFSTFS